MPYITQERRQQLDTEIDALIKKINYLPDLCKGDLNYICYKLGLAYIEIKGKSYQNISDGGDALRGASEELKRRVQDPYEDTKIVSNGDIVITNVVVQSQVPRLWMPIPLKEAEKYLNTYELGVDTELGTNTVLSSLGKPEYDIRRDRPNQIGVDTNLPDLEKIPDDQMFKKMKTENE